MSAAVSYRATSLTLASCNGYSLSSARAPSFILPPKHMWTARYSGQRSLFARTSKGRFNFWRQPGHTGRGSPIGRQPEFRFLHVSTDEVYGSLAPDDPAFTERTAYAPNSPYSATKAASDHLVRAYRHTYGLPVLTTNCSNNYGPRQFPEKLIPLMILNALKGLPLPVYGDGQNVRDWLYVSDHCDAIRTVLRIRPCRVRLTTSAAGDERPNIEIVKSIRDLVRCRPAPSLDEVRRTRI